MKTNENQKTNNKFDLKKMNVAKLKNIHKINGGCFDDPMTGTATSSRCNKDSVTVLI